MSVEQLNEKLDSLKKDLFFLRMQHATNQLDNPLKIAENRLSHADYFRRAAYYIRQTYGIEPDRSGKDLSRACFLPHDPNAYLNPKYATR